MHPDDMGHLVAMLLVTMLFVPAGGADGFLSHSSCLACGYHYSLM